MCQPNGMVGTNATAGTNHKIYQRNTNYYRDMAICGWDQSIRTTHASDTRTGLTCGESDITTLSNDLLCGDRLYDQLTMYME